MKERERESKRGKGGGWWGGGGAMLTKQRDCGEQREREENESGETSKGFFRPGYRDNRHLHAISFLHHIKEG